MLSFSLRQQIPRSSSIIKRPACNSVETFSKRTSTAQRAYTTSVAPARRLTPYIAGGLLLTTAAAAATITNTPNIAHLTTTEKVTEKAKTMSSKLIPPNAADVMVIRDVTPNIVTLSVPFNRFGVLKVGGRGTIVKLTSGNLAVFSPVALTPEVEARIKTLGTGKIAYIVAPDIEHHIFISEWARAFPDAKLIGPEGLPEKRAKANDDKIGNEPFFKVFSKATKLTTKITEEFDADFEYEYVEPHPNKEIVFFYKPDRVLIQADLMFNLPPTEQYSRVTDPEQLKEGVLSRIFAGLQNPAGEATGMKRVMWYLFSRADRTSFNESMQRIDTWNFDTMIPCHGDTLVGNGKEVFEKVFEWHLQGKH
jgi:hypothetical protein